MGVSDKPDDPFANVSKSIAAGGNLPAGDVPETKRKSAACPRVNGSAWCQPMHRTREPRTTTMASLLPRGATTMLTGS